MMLNNIIRKNTMKGKTPGGVLLPIEMAVLKLIRVKIYTDWPTD